MLKLKCWQNYAHGNIKQLHLRHSLEIQKTSTEKGQVSLLDTQESSPQWEGSGLPRNEQKEKMKDKAQRNTFTLRGRNRGAGGLGRVRREGGRMRKPS